MRAYLLVDHGSRLEEANGVVAAVAQAMSLQLDARVAHAHQEAAQPSIDEAIDALVAEGVRALIVVPFFLAPGRHATRDVPRLARESGARHAGLVVEVIEAPLPRATEALATLLVARVRDVIVPTDP